MNAEDLLCTVSHRRVIDYEQQTHTERGEQPHEIGPTQRTPRRGQFRAIGNDEQHCGTDDKNPKQNMTTAAMLKWRGGLSVRYLSHACNVLTTLTRSERRPSRTSVPVRHP